MLGPRYATRRAVLGDLSNVTATVVPEITRSSAIATSTHASMKYATGSSMISGSALVEEKVRPREGFDWLMFILGGSSVISRVCQ
jgi:hypothetical protein